MRKIGLLVATVAATAAFIAPSTASAVTTPQLQIAANLCQQQGGIFYVTKGGFSCTGTMTLFDLVKAKTVCSLLFGGSLATLPATGPSILLAPNGGYSCGFGSF